MLRKPSREKGGGRRFPGRRVMLAMAVATSIDALAVGITLRLFRRGNPAGGILHRPDHLFALRHWRAAWPPLWGRFQARAEGLGGLILILLGVKILLEHLGIL